MLVELWTLLVRGRELVREVCGGSWLMSNWRRWLDIWNSYAMDPMSVWSLLFEDCNG